MNPLSGVSFYRIRAVDIDGKSSYSAIIRVSNSIGAGLTINLYPNPVINKELNIQASDLKQGAYQILIVDYCGKELFREQIQVNSASFSHHIVMPSSLAKGNHVLMLKGNGENISKIFSVQ